MNGDGLPDLVLTSNTVGVLLNAGGGTFTAATQYDAGDGPHGVAVADLNGDGRPDVAAADYGGNNVSVLINACLP